MNAHVRFLGSDWVRVATPDGSDLRVQHGPGPADTTGLARWLRQGCRGLAPINQGFLAVLVEREGSVVAAGSSRLETALLYSVSDTQLLVAYHPRDIANALPTKPELNVQKLADLMALYDDPATTVFEGIDRLPIGHRLTWHPGVGRPRVSRWFTPLELEPLRIKPADAPGLMRETVREAVRDSLPASGDVAATLSGGLDSSMVVGTAASILGPRDRAIHCVTHRPLSGTPDPSPGWIADDGPDAEAMCRELPGTTWTGLRNDALVTPLEAVQADFDLSWSPSLNPSNAVWLTAAVDFASSVSSLILLTGATGNGPFSRGRAGVIRSARPSQRPAIAWRQIVARHELGASPTAAFKTVMRESVPLRVDESYGRVRRGKRQTSGGFLEHMPFGGLASSSEATAALAQLLSPRRDQRSWLNLVLRDASLGLVGQYRRPYVWWSDPLSDQRVIALAVGLPPESWIADGRDRSLARAAAAGIVPEGVRLREVRGSQAADANSWRAGKENLYLAAVASMHGDPVASQLINLARVEELLTDRRSVPAAMWESTVGRALGLGLFTLWWGTVKSSS